MGSTDVQPSGRASAHAAFRIIGSAHEPELPLVVLGAHRVGRPRRTGAEPERLGEHGDAPPGRDRCQIARIDDWLAEYEAEHGVITEEEMDEAERWAAANTIKVRGGEVLR